jgi:hypothetical protein
MAMKVIRLGISLIIPVAPISCSDRGWEATCGESGWDDSRDRERNS